MALVSARVLQPALAPPLAPGEKTTGVDANEIQFGLVYADHARDLKIRAWTGLAGRTRLEVLFTHAEITGLAFVADLPSAPGSRHE